MDFSNINWLAVLACVLSNMVIGFIWYSPQLFFKPWWAGIGKKATDESRPTPSLWISTILAAFVEAVFVGLLLKTMGSASLLAGLQAGFMIWLGFVAPTNLVNNLFAERGFKVWLIEAGNHLINLLAMGAILAAWQ